MRFKQILILIALNWVTAHYTQALESTDVLDANILKVYNKNVLVLDRGAEDGIFKRDHIQITSQAGFIARGICLKANLITSHWKIYRVVRPELMSKDATYQLRSINQSAIPKDLRKFASVDFSKKLPNFDRKEQKQLKLQQDRIVNYDLPNQVKLTETVKEKEKSSFNKFVDRNISNEVLRLDLSRNYLDLFASPISIQTRNDQKEVHYGFQLRNFGAKYRYEVEGTIKELDYVDPVSKESYTSNSSNYYGGFQINRVTDSLSLLSELSYFDETIGDIEYPKSRVRVSPLGLRFHFWEENAKTNFMDFSYSPSFESLEYTDPTNSGLKKLSGLRHKLKARIYSEFTKKILNRTELIYAPMSSSNLEDISSSKLLYVQASSNFMYDMGDKFFLEYELSYEADKFRNHIYGVSPDNTTQTFRLRKGFDI